MNDDLTLLREFARNNSEAAFAALVSRHIALVYSVALRQVRDAHLADEITQAVFIILARKADSLGDKTILSGWLCRTARYASANVLTIQRRRQKREQEAFMQSQLESRTGILPVSETETEMWNEISPLLDAAMEKLGQKDHDALVLRFFENKNFAEVAATLGASEDAAKMRISRALEKLRKFFTKRGVSSTTAIIAGTISANSVQAAPIGLAKTISAVAIAKGAAASASTLTLIKGALKIMAWTKMKTAVVVGVGVIIAIAISTIVVAQKNKGLNPNATDSVVTDDSLLVVPHVSVGKVKAGMTEDDVIAALGQPDRRQGDVLVYDKELGLSVVCSRKKIVGAVFCGSSMLKGPGVKIFKERTKEGIGMESSREDVIKAFGQPTSAKPWSAAIPGIMNAQEQIEYTNLGLTFLLESGKVFNITVDFRIPQK